MVWVSALHYSTIQLPSWSSKYLSERNGKAALTISSNGGMFQILPVTVESAGIVLEAKLRIGIHAGIVLSTHETSISVEMFNHSIPLQLKGGIETSAYVDLVDFSGNLTYAHKDDPCEVNLALKYRLGVGAAAGASVQAGSHTWGPAVEKNVPVWTTTFADWCATRPPATVTSPAITSGVEKRAALSTTTTVTTRTYTGVQCQSNVAGNCPASLQVTSRTTEATTLSTAVSSGVQVTWPETPGVANVVSTTVPFDNHAYTITPTSGIPSAYTASTIKGIETALDADVDHVNKKLIYGLAFGIGLPIIITGIVAAFV